MKLLFALLITQAFAWGLTNHQTTIKNLVNSESCKYTKFRTLMSNICETESSYGMNILGDKGHALGVMQLSHGAVQDVSRWYPKLKWLGKLPKKRLETLLLTNHRLNIKIATLYFENMRQRYGWRKALSRYNGGNNNTSYINRVLSKRKGVK